MQFNLIIIKTLEAETIKKFRNFKRSLPPNLMTLLMAPRACVPVFLISKPGGMETRSMHRSCFMRLMLLDCFGRALARDFAGAFAREPRGQISASSGK